MTAHGSPERRPDGAAFAIAAFLLLVGVILIVEGYRVPSKAGYSGVGAGDVPRLIGWALVLLSGWTAIDGWRNPGPPRARQHPVPLIWLLGGMAVMVATIHSIGFILGVTILFIAATAAFGERRFHISAPVGLVMGVLIYAVFDQLLQLNLPAGPIETLIFGG